MITVLYRFVWKKGGPMSTCRGVVSHPYFDYATNKGLTVWVMHSCFCYSWSILTRSITLSLLNWLHKHPRIFGIALNWIRSGCQNFLITQGRNYRQFILPRRVTWFKFDSCFGCFKFHLRHNLRKLRILHPL